MGHKFKKQFGQNFLRNLRYAHQLVDGAAVAAGDTVIEIGPGDGSVTKVLLQQQAQVIAVEVDYDLIVTLIKRFNWAENFELEHADILETDVTQLLTTHAKNLDSQHLDRGYKLVGSLPYNISKHIILKFVTTPPRPAVMCVIVQAEVGTEYVAQPPQATFLSNWISLYADVRKLATIPKAQFNPQPQVDGAILQITPRPLSANELTQVASIGKFIRNGFAAPRKTLWNNLRSLNTYTDDQLKAAWVQLALSPTARAAELSLNTWKQLYTVLTNTN